MPGGASLALQVLPWAPVICASLLMLQQAGRRTSRRLGKGDVRLKDDNLDAERPLFAVFVTDDDILEASGFPQAGAEGDAEANPATTAEAVLPPPPLSIVLVPLVEAAGWTIVTLGYVVAYGGPAPAGALLLAASHVLAWGYALARQLGRRTATAPLALLSLYVVLMLDTLFAVVQQLRRFSNEAPSARTLTRLPDLILTFLLIGAIFRMPLNAPLDVAIRVEQIAAGAATSSDEIRPRSPEDANTVLGALTYAWMGGIMRTARSRSLGPMDVWALSLNNRAEVLSRRFKSLRRTTLTRKLLRASARDIAIDATLKLVAVSSEYLRPYFIQKILENLTVAYTSQPAADMTLSPTSLMYRVLGHDEAAPWTPIEKAYLYTFLAFLSALGKTLAQQRHFHYARRIGMRLSSELTIALFEKSLRRRENSTPVINEEASNESPRAASASVGKVTTMISDDVNRVLRMGCDSHLIYGAPLEITLGIIFLYNLMGWSAFVGVGVIAVGSPLTFATGKKAQKIMRERQVARDTRQTALQELLSDIRAIKLFGWSAAWIDRVEQKRNVELKWLLQNYLIRYAYTATWALVTVVVPVASFWAYVKVAGQELTVAVAFTALSLFTLIRGPMDQIPGFGIRILQLNVSISRMESFFAEDEVSAHADLVRRRSCQRLRLQNATMRYAGGSANQFALEDVTVDFPENALSIVSGPTGSGKTSLLLGLLGELEVIAGTVELPVEVSYAAQYPWLESLSLRDNVLFGYPVDERRYRNVLKACALERDLEMLPDGDATFIGERGIALSGGQKARLALARAVYAPTRYVLLDDVFSAVDAYTARSLVDELFSSTLMQGRTVVLITHHVDIVLPIAHHHIEMSRGRVSRQTRLERPNEVKPSQKTDRARRAEPAPATLGTPAHPEGLSSPVVAKVEPEPVTAVKKESWTTGEVKRKMYHKYLSSSGYILWSLTVICLVARPVFAFFEQFWLKRWGEAAGSGNIDSTHFLLGYAAISAATASTTILNELFLMAASVTASRTLFEQLLVRVVHAPLRWFDLVPLGTINNRFSNDIAGIDDEVAYTMNMFISNVSKIVAALVVSSLVLPASLTASLVFIAVYVKIFRSYLLVNRDANRIASTTASPLFSSFADALRGIVTIRAFSKGDGYRRRLCHIVDETLAYWYLAATLDIWLSIRTQLLSACCLLSTATFATYFRISPGLAGIAITSSQALIQALDVLCNSYGRLVLAMNRIERVVEYLEVPQEPADGIVPPATWPSLDASVPLLEVDDVVLSYDPLLPPVLHGVSFTAQAGERIGIVGRTGSGKTTLASALLRFVDPTSGSIRVAGLDIAKVSIEHVRQRISLVPQEPSLFAGTLRENLDPFGEHSDEACLAALKRAHLHQGPVAATAASGPSERGEDSQDGLLALPVAAGGTNWSAGQRQLIAVARALLRDARVVILDESSASLDPNLDTMIQQVISEEFNESVVLAIAHRLRTVIEYDRIIVLDAGRIVEYDTPAALLARPTGVLRGMWDEQASTPGRSGSATPTGSQ